MNNSRSRLIQVLTPTGWQWVFCWSVNGGRIVTTEDYRKAIRDEGTNLAYFREKAAGAVFRATSPAALEAPALAA